MEEYVFMKNESNFTQEITLPSQGLFNPEIPEGKLIQRCMMVSDQKFLSGSNQSAGSAINQLIQRTITSPEGFDVSKLTVADTLYLLFKLRVLSYGKDYTFRTRCPECGKKIDVSLDLSELPVEILEPGFEDNLIVKLPNRQDTVYTKVLTNEDTEEIDREIKRRKRRNKDDDSEYILRIVRSIIKIELAKPNQDGKSELTGSLDIERYVSSLTNLDASAIISARDSITYGITPIIEYVCPECREYIDVSIQFSSGFFRPTFSK